MVSRLQAFCLLVDSIPLLGPEEQVRYRKKLDALAAELEPLGNDPYVRRRIDSYLATKATA